MNRFEPTLHIRQGMFEGQIDDRLPGTCGYNIPQWIIKAPFSRRDAAAIEGAYHAHTKFRLTWQRCAGDAIIKEWLIRQGYYRKSFGADQPFPYLEVIFEGVGPIVAAEAK